MNPSGSRSRMYRRSILNFKAILALTLGFLALGAPPAAGTASPQRELLLRGLSGAAPALREFLQPPPPPAEPKGQQASGQGRALSDEPSISQRVARWFFSSDRPPAAPHAEGYGPPPSQRYGPPQPFGQYGPPAAAHGQNGGPGRGSSKGPHSGEYGQKSPSNLYAPAKPPPHHNGPLSPRRNPYVPPKPGHHLGPPPPSPGQYGPPPSPQYGPPKPHAPGPAYGGPPHHPPGGIGQPHPGHNKARECNPCNKVPWQPMPRTPTGTSDQVHLSSPPHSQSNNSPNSYLPPGPTQAGSEFAPPKPPSGEYGAPNSARQHHQDQYSGPAETAHGGPPGAGNHFPPQGGASPGHFGAQGSHGGAAGPEGNHGAHDDYGPPPLPPLLQAPATSQGDYFLSGQLLPPSTSANGISNAVASFRPLPPVNNAPYVPPSGVSEYLTPPSTGAGGSEQYLGPPPPAPGLPTGPATSGPAQPLAQKGHDSPTGPGGDLDIIKSVSVYSESETSLHHSQGGHHNSNANTVHLSPEGQAHNADDQIHLPSGDNDGPGSEDANQIIALGHSSTHHNRHNDSDEGLEVIKSVRVADFLSSVEYPPEVVQSPYIDLTPPSSENKDHYSSAFNHAYNTDVTSPEEIILGRPEGSDGNRNVSLNSYQLTSASEDSSLGKETEEHLGLNHASPGSWPNDSNSIHSPKSNNDQKPSSSNKNIIQGLSETNHSSQYSDLSLSGNNFYSSGSVSESIIRNEGHPLQGLSKNLTSHSSFTSHLQSQDQAHVINGNEKTPLYQPQGHLQNLYASAQSQSTSASQHIPVTPGSQSSVIVDVQPSIQTASQGASLIYQINGLNTPQSQFSHTYPNTPAQTSVFVSFQHALQKPFNYEPPTLLNQQLPPPAPFHQNGFHHSPPSPPVAPFQTHPRPPFHNAFQTEYPATYIKPPGPPPFKTFHTVQSPATMDSVPPVASQPHPLWANVGTPGIRTHTKTESESTNLAGILPPPPPNAAQNTVTPISHFDDSKGTKQIQIIVPYTSSKDLIQFRFPGANSGTQLDATGWSPIPNAQPSANEGRTVPKPNNCGDIISDGSVNPAHWQERCRDQGNTPKKSVDPQDDYHQHQESRRVTSKTPLNDNIPHNHKNIPHIVNPGLQNGQVQHIIASNIRDLLRNEEETKQTTDSINLLQLQKNIDDWTALEFSKHRHLDNNHKTSERDKGFTSSSLTGTTLHHLRLPSKQIPEEYLTTTSLPVDETDQSDFFSPTAAPSLKLNDISRTSPSSLFFDHEVSGSSTHSITANIEEKVENKSQSSLNTSSNDSTWKFFESNLVLPEAVTVATTTQPPTTTEEYTEQTTEMTEPTVQTNWDHLKVSISPITKEKVYVVTPLSTWVSPSINPTVSPMFSSTGTYPALSFKPSSPRPSPTSINDIIPFRKSVLSPADMLGVTPLPFHSPRFLIRPTPSPSLHRLFTMKSSESGFFIPSSPVFEKDEVSSEDDDPYADAEDEGGDDNSIRDDTYSSEQEEAEDSTAPPTNSTQLGSTAAPAPSGLALSDLLTYTPPAGARVHTYTGHSKVVVVVTPTTLIPKKKQSGLSDKKTTTPSSTKAMTSSALEEAPATTSAPPPAPATPPSRAPKDASSGNAEKPTTRADADSYLWHFSGLLDGDELLDEEDVASVREAALDLQKEKRS